MRKLLFLAVLLAAVTVRADDFQDANADYLAGHFREARDGYEGLVKKGTYSANLFYNLGNAWYRLDDSGKAALNLKRALALDPTLPEARANLTLIQEKTGAQIPDAPKWLAYYPTLGRDAYTWIAVGAGWIFLFALITRLTGLSRKRLVLGVALAALVVGLTCLPVLREQRKDERDAVVINLGAKAQFAPTSAGEAAGTLPPGSVVRELAARGDWTYATAPDGRDLWFPSADLERVNF